MGARSDFPRRKSDAYLTWDPRPVPALLAHLAPGTRFVAPCAGQGHLIDHLTAAGHTCVLAYDIEPGRGDVQCEDALTFRPSVAFDCFIENTPWTRAILHPLIEHLSDMAPTWLLFDSEWKNTLQAIPLLPRLRRVLACGRTRWIEGSPYDGVDSVSWHLFERPGTRPYAEFYGRLPRACVDAVAA